MRFPFAIDEDGSNETIGKTFVSYLNPHGESSYESVFEITFRPDGKSDEGWRWETLDGILRILDDTGVVIQTFSGVQLVNGVISATGYSVDGPILDAILSEKKKLASANWNIFVSASPNHCDGVGKKLAKSLRRANVDMDKVTMVSGGIPVESGFVKKMDGMNHISRVCAAGGCTALCSHSDADYRVLLHGTSEVSEDFQDRIEELDVGLNPDIILFRPDWSMGVYSERFLEEQEDLASLDQKTRMRTLRLRANIVVTNVARVEVGKPSGVYNDGVVRTGMSLPKFGITKFKSVPVR